LRKFKIGKYVIPLWIVVILLISGIAASAYYAWQTLTIQLEVKEPLEILSYPQQLSLYPGETREFNVTIRNHASVNYSVILDFSLDNITYQSSYVTFSNEIYTVIPGQQNLTAWLAVESYAPATNVMLTIDCRRGIYPSGIVGYWRFDEGAGTIAFDSSKNNNHGLLVNGPLWVNGKYCKALSFDGIDDYVRIEASPSVKISNTVTVAAWVKIEGTTNDHQVILAQNYGDESSYVLEFQPNGQTPQFCVLNSYGKRADAISNITIQFGEWVHLVGTYDGVTVRLYVNGALIGTKGLFGPIDVENQPVQIGAHTASWDRNWFNGIIDEVMLYNRAMNAEEIKALYTSGLP